MYNIIKGFTVVVNFNPKFLSNEVGIRDEKKMSGNV